MFNKQKGVEVVCQSGGDQVLHIAPAGSICSFHV